jgi:response regulator of citrate/malate metabolism
VLVVDDETLIADAHAQYVGRVPGFTVAGVVNSGAEALRFVRAHPVDLILLDFNLPDVHGLEVSRALRAARVEVDIIAVTSNRDLAAVRAAVSLGIVQYLLKPFTFSSLRDKLERYSEYRSQMTTTQPLSAQSEVDRAFATLRGRSLGTLPPGLSEETLEAVAQFVRDKTAASAREVAEGSGVSRVTARRYLEHLSDSGVLRRRQRHGRSGRPEIEFEWRGQA